MFIVAANDVASRLPERRTLVPKVKYLALKIIKNKIKYDAPRKISSIEI